MQIQQISVFVENKSGRLADITEALAAAGVDIRALSIADTSDFGILRLIVDHPDKAVQALRDAGMTVSLTNVLAMGIDDKPGEFSKAMRVLADNGIGVEYMYAFISRESAKAYVILRVQDNDSAAQALQDNGIALLSAEDLTYRTYRSGCSHLR